MCSQLLTGGQVSARFRVKSQGARSRTCSFDSKFSAHSWHDILAPSPFVGRGCASEHQNGETGPLGCGASKNWKGHSPGVWLRGEQGSYWVPSSV